MPPLLDGFDMWKALSEDLPSPRNLILHNIDETRHIASLRVGDWKLVKGTTYQGRWDNWYGPSGRSSNYSYDYQKVLKSPTGLSLKAINVPLPNKAKMNSLRKSVDVQCKRPKHASACQPLQQMCLFNILSDPCELNNVIFKYPDVVRIMESTLEMYKKTEVPRGNKSVDPRADPKLYNYTWTNWWDMIEHKEDGTNQVQNYPIDPETVFNLI